MYVLSDVSVTLALFSVGSRTSHVVKDETSHKDCHQMKLPPQNTIVLLFPRWDGSYPECMASDP